MGDKSIKGQSPIILPKKKPFRIRTLISRIKSYPFEPEVLKQQGESEKAKEEGKEKLRKKKKIWKILKTNSQV